MTRRVYGIKDCTAEILKHKQLACKTVTLPCSCEDCKRSSSEIMLCWHLHVLFPGAGDENQKTGVIQGFCRRE